MHGFSRKTRPAWRSVNKRGTSLGASSAGRVGDDRRMALLKRAGLFSNDTHGAKITRAASLEDLSEAYRLVHDVFVERGYIRPQANGYRIRVFEAMPETATFVAKCGSEMVGVTSVLVDSPDLGLPSDQVFGPEIDALRAQGRQVCEGTNWLVAESHRKSAVMSELMRSSFAHAMAEGCTDFIGSVSPGHARFYGLLGFETLAGPKNYSNEVEDPVVLVRLDLAGLSKRFEGVEASDNQVERFLKQYYVDENPYHRFVGGWKVLSDRLFADPISLGELFVHRSGLLSDCPAEVCRALRKRWSAAVFDAVVPAETSAPAKTPRAG